MFERIPSRARRLALLILSLTLPACGRLQSSGMSADASLREAGDHLARTDASARGDATSDAEAGIGSVIDGGCTLGSVTFVLRANGCAVTSSNPGDEFFWYSVLEADGGAPVPIFYDTITQALRGTCAFLGNVGGFGCTAIPDAGVTAVWNGTHAGARSSCDSESMHVTLPCQPLLCTPAGAYVARMCTGSEVDPGVPVACTNVPFTYPEDTLVVGVILDAGTDTGGG
jgi:hypothetical protein